MDGLHVQGMAQDKGNPLGGAKIGDPVPGEQTLNRDDHVRPERRQHFENAKVVSENGEQVGWIKPEGAEATMRSLMSSKLVSIAKPTGSLLLRKPLQDGIKHGGGQKMVMGDMAYKAFRTWLEDYAAMVGDKYTLVANLPTRKDGPQHYGIERITPPPPITRGPMVPPTFMVLRPWPSWRMVRMKSKATQSKTGCHSRHPK